MQGFNRIAAIALLFMNEEDAFWALVYIVEVVNTLYKFGLYCRGGESFVKVSKLKVLFPDLGFIKANFRW